LPRCADLQLQLLRSTALPFIHSTRDSRKAGSRHFGLLTAFGQNVYSSIADILARHTTEHVTYAMEQRQQTMKHRRGA